MEYITLNNGVKMPMLGFGTFKAAGEDCSNSVTEAIRAGYRMIDTAEAYGNEKDVAAGIAAAGVERKELFLVTKVKFRSYDHARESVLQSMENLKTDYLDLVLLHWPFGNYYAAWRELEKLYEEGKIRAIGISNFDPDRMIDLISFNRIKPQVNQTETNLYCQRQKEHEWEDQYDIAHMAYSPLGQGQAKTMFAEPKVQAIAAAHGKSPAQVLLRFLMQSGVIVIPKSVHADRIRQNFDVFDFQLTEEEMERLRSLDKAQPVGGRAEDVDRLLQALTW